MGGVLRWSREGLGWDWAGVPCGDWAGFPLGARERGGRGRGRVGVVGVDGEGVGRAVAGGAGMSRGFTGGVSGG